MSDLRHKTPEQLRAEIKYQERMIASYDESIKWSDTEIAMMEETIKDEQKKLVEYRMKRNNHHQRMVWAKNYLLIKNSD